MPPQDRIWCRALLLALCASVARCIDCYYPDGKVAPDQPCSTADGAACCPENWQCLDNGLCYYPPDNFYGRYTCTDQTWKSPLCPSNLCTYGLTAVGDEAILQCSNHNDQWCCDRDRTSVHCCTDDNVQYFDMPQGKAYATIGSDAIPSTAPTVNSFGNEHNGGGNSASSSAAAAAAASSYFSSSISFPSSSSITSYEMPSSSEQVIAKTTPPVTSIRTSLSSGTGGVETIFITTAITPTSAPSSSSNPVPVIRPHNASHLGVIVGCAVGIPVALGLVGILAFFLIRRRKTSSAPNSPEKSSATTSPNLFKSDPSTTATPYGPPPSELAANSIGPARPISVLKGRAELEGPPSVQGTPMHRPSDSWGTAPPGYSPGMAVQPWGPGRYGEAGTGASGAGTENVVGTGGVGQAVTTAGGRYIPYRPSMEEVPGRVELPAGEVRAPPA